MTQKEKSYYFHFHKDDVTWPFSVSPVSGALSHGKWIFSRLFSSGNLLQSHVGQVCLMHNHSHARLSFQFVSYIKFSQWCHFTTATRIPLLFIFLIETKTQTKTQTEKIYTFLRKKLIKKQNCLLNDLNFINDYLKFL